MTEALQRLHLLIPSHQVLFIYDLFIEFYLLRISFISLFFYYSFMYSIVIYHDFNTQILEGHIQMITHIRLPVFIKFYGNTAMLTSFCIAVSAFAP